MKRCKNKGVNVKQEKKEKEGAFKWGLIGSKVVELIRDELFPYMLDQKNTLQECFFFIITYLFIFVCKMGHCSVIVCSIWFITLERDISLPSGRVFFGSGNFI